MVLYWNVGAFTYHVTLDIEKGKAKIEKHDGDDKKVGRSKTFKLSRYEACQSRYDVEELYKSKEK